MFEFRTGRGDPYRVEINAADQHAARRLLENQYGKVTISKIEEKRQTASKFVASRGGEASQDTGELVGGLLLIVVAAPFLAMLGAPSLLAYQLLSLQGTHSGIVLLAVLGTLALTGLLLFLIFAFLPQSVLVLLGFALYGAIGYAFGSDQIWKLIIGSALGLLGATISYYIGAFAKSLGSDDENRNLEEDDDDFEEFDDVDEEDALVRQTSRRRSQTSQLH